MNKLMKICSTYKTYDIVLIPFPFTDSELSKNRPALILSSDKLFNNKINHSIAAMITSIQHYAWPFDVEIEELKACGLSKPSIIRLKLFTIDHRLIRSKIGVLAKKDQVKIRKNLSIALGDLWNFD